MMFMNAWIIYVIQRFRKQKQKWHFDLAYWLDEGGNIAFIAMFILLYSQLLKHLAFKTLGGS